MRAVIWIILGAAGCGGFCVAGQSIECTCINGQTGAQVCQQDRTYGACDCSTPPGNGKKVFVTSATYGAAFGNGANTGRVGADLLCNNSAKSAGLTGTFVAWLSNEARPGLTLTNAADAVTGDGPWYRIDGMKAFNNHANLSTIPLVSLDFTEQGQKLPVTQVQRVWTGTGTGGTLGAADCDAWITTGDTVEGQYGDPNTPAQWTDAGGQSCNNQAHLYCFEQ
jgi:hypothetical protein